MSQTVSSSHRRVMTGEWVPRHLQPFLVLLIPRRLIGAFFDLLADPCHLDSSSRIWNFDGNCLTTLPGHGDDRYIYSLISMPDHAGGGLASSGEDGIIKLWDDEDGEEQQEILVPAQSVWSLTSLENGDLACGCSDSRIWIFTRDETRTADEVTRTEYESSLAKRRKPAASPALPTVSAEALSSPGTKEGDVKLVETDGTIHAYQVRYPETSLTLTADPPLSLSLSAVVDRLIKLDRSR